MLQTQCQQQLPLQPQESVCERHQHNGKENRRDGALMPASIIYSQLHQLRSPELPCFLRLAGVGFLCLTLKYC